MKYLRMINESDIIYRSSQEMKYLKHISDSDKRLSDIEILKDSLTSISDDRIIKFSPTSEKIEVMIELDNYFSPPTYLDKVGIEKLRKSNEEMFSIIDLFYEGLNRSQIEYDEVFMFNIPVKTGDSKYYIRSIIY